jgi:hypothetical protein
MHCPNCGGENTVQVEPALSAGQIGEFSLAGMQLKFPAREVARATCTACPLNLIGRIEGATFGEDGRTFTGGHFVIQVPGQDRELRI